MKARSPIEININRVFFLLKIILTIQISKFDACKDNLHMLKLKKY